jgi:enoyl-CoA hydratase/carnithine racemase
METAQFRVEKISPSFWEVTFQNPPINLVDPQSITELNALLERAESDPHLTVVVFVSADPDFFIAHYDIASDLGFLATAEASSSGGDSGLDPWNAVLARLARAPLLTIAALRGRARGAGSEFALACDLRFASREKAVLGQFEVGGGAVPGGGPMARLSRLVGRGRALEIVIGADDFSADLAERYGYVNRAVPDAEFEDFVREFALRVAGFEKPAVVTAKGFVDVATLPGDAELAPGMGAFFDSVGRPETQARAMAMFQAGLQTRSDTELRLGDFVAKYKPAS